jgi:predicted PurR-regulated permease PerM
MPLLQTSRERAGLLIALLAAGVAIALSPFLSGLLGAAVLYVIFVNPYRYLERMVKPGVAAAAILAAALVLIALPLSWLI